MCLSSGGSRGSRAQAYVHSPCSTASQSCTEQGGSLGLHVKDAGTKTSSGSRTAVNIPDMKVRGTRSALPTHASAHSSSQAVQLLHILLYTVHTTWLEAQSTAPGLWRAVCSTARCTVHGVTEAHRHIRRHTVHMARMHFVPMADR